MTNPRRTVTDEYSNPVRRQHRLGLPLLIHDTASLIWHSKLVIWILIESVCLAPVIAASTLRTIDGKSYEGEIRFDNTQLMLTPSRGQPPLRFNVDQLLQATFRGAGPVQTHNPVQLGGGQLPGGWKPLDIGLVGTPGTARFYNNLFALKGAGANVEGNADSCFFLSQEINGDVTLTARLVDMQHGDPLAKTGLMLRAATDPGARALFCYVSPRSGVDVIARVEPGGQMAHARALSESTPVWLRIVRRQNLITSFRSADGRSWMQIDQREIVLEPHLWMGLAVCSHDKSGMLAASFDHVDLRYGEPRDEDHRPQQNSAPAGRALVFRRGTTLVNVQLTAVTDKTIDIQRPDGKPMTLPLADVSRVILAPLPPQLAEKLPDHGTGALLARGDFLEGEVQALAGGRVRISSILFGISNLAVGSEAVALLLNDAEPSSSTWIVHSSDGSVYHASDLKIERDQLVISDESIGIVKVPVWSLQEIRIGELRSDSLVNQIPQVQTQQAGSTVPAYSAGIMSNLRMNLDGVTSTSGIAVSSGTSLTYQLDGKYRAFLATAGIPQNTLPTIAASYTVSIDGVEAYRSEPHTSLDDPLTISIPLTGAAKLTLTVQPSSLPTTILFCDPLLMK